MSPSAMKRRLAMRCQALTRLARDTRGIAAVEFAYVVPVLLLILVATAEVTRAVSMDRRLALVTSMIADLVAREEKMTADDVNAVYNIVSQVMSPFDSNSLKVSIIPVKASPTDPAMTRVYAGTTNRPSFHGASQPAKCSSYTLASDLAEKGASVIVVETSYNYAPMFLDFIFGTANWTDKAIASPRNSCVDFDGDNCVSTCF